MFASKCLIMFICNDVYVHNTYTSTMYFVIYSAVPCSWQKSLINIISLLKSSMQDNNKTHKHT